jgi:hypothetical protein
MDCRVRRSCRSEVGYVVGFVKGDEILLLRDYIFDRLML